MVVNEEDVPPAMVGRVKFLITNVCQSTQVDHATIQSISPQFNGCVRNHPSTLFKLCSFISAGEPVMTRNQLNEHYQGVFVDEEINLLLVGLHCPTGADGRPADFNQTNVFKAFALLCKKIMDSIIFLNAKLKSGISAVALLKYFDTEFVKLKSLHVDLLGLRIPKEAATQQGIHCLDVKNLFIDRISEFCKLHNAAMNETAFFFIPNRNVANQFDYTLFSDKVNDANTSVLEIWQDYYNVPNFDPYHLPVVNQKSDLLTPIIKEINSYAPSVQSANLSRCRNLKPLCTKLVTEIEKLRDDDSVKVSLLKAALKEFEIIKKAVMDLQISGIILSEDNLGVNPDNFFTLYKEFQVLVAERDKTDQLQFQAVKSAQSEIAKSSYNHAKLQLTPLKGPKDWLNFKQSCEKILPYLGGPEGDILKSATIQSALFVTDDQQFCRTTDSHKEMLKYLTAKYETPDLIPSLITDLLRLKPPRDYNQSYKNLTQFEILTQHLKNAKSEHRLDKSTRNQILPVCLTDADRRLFCQDELSFDQGLVEELQNAGLAPDDDSASVVLESSEHLLEDKRREFFVSKLLEYLKISKAMINSAGSSISSPSSGIPSNRFKQRRNQNSPGFFQAPQGAKCPLCKVVHLDQQNRPLVSLGRCIKFQQLSVTDRQNTVKKLNYCSRCLRDKSQFPHSNNVCQISEDRGLLCKNHVTPSNSHHPLLCNTKDSTSKIKQPNKPKPYKQKPKLKGATKANLTSVEKPPNQGSTSGFCNDIWEFQPQYLPRLTMLNQTVNFKTSTGSTNMLSLRDRALFTSATCCNVVAPQGHLFSCITLLDNGSGLGFVSQHVVDTHKLKHVGYWHGKVVTLNGAQENKYSVYEVVLLDNNNRKHPIRVLLVPSLGAKRYVPRSLFSKVCASYGVGTAAVSNLEGFYGLLIGIDAVHLLGSKVPHFNSTRYQNTALFQSVLCKQYYILGTVGPPLNSASFNSTQVYNTSCENVGGATSNLEEKVVKSRLGPSTFQSGAENL